MATLQSDISMQEKKNIYQSPVWLKATETC